MKSSLRTITFCAISVLYCVLASGTQKFLAQGTQSRQLDRQTDSVKTWPIKAKRWALVIGVDQYRDGQINALKGSVNDAHNLANALVRYAGFPQDQVIVLTTDQPEERQPTRINILTYLSNLASLVPKDGLLLVSFAGHGIERGGQAYLIPSDARLSRDVSLLEESAVSVTRMHDRIKAIGVGQVIVLLDACRNDPGGRAGAPNNMGAAYTKFNFDVRNREVQAFATFYATAIGQRAYEYTEKHQGYFTWAIVEGLKGGAGNEKGEVTLAALVKYVQDNVPKRIAIDLGASEQQKPFATIEGYRADELVIAIAAANTGIVASGETTVASAEQSYNSAIAYVREQRDEEARQKFNEAIRLRPRFSMAHYDLGLLFIGQRKWDQALASFESALNGDLKPTWIEAWAHIRRGNIYDAKGERAHAVEEYDKALRTGIDYVGSFGAARGFINIPYDPGTVPAGTQGQAIQNDGRPILKRLDPSVDSGTVTTGGNNEATSFITLFEQKRYGDAALRAKIVTYSNPENAQAWEIAGLSEFALKQYSEAAKDLQKVLDLQPAKQQDTKIVDALGQAYFYDDKFDRAVPLLLATTTRASAKSDATLHYQLGFAYYRTKRDREAIAEFKSAIRIKRDYVIAHFFLGMSYLAVGDKSSAMDEYKILRTLDPDTATKLYAQITK